VADGCGDEERFDPLAALFEILEELEFVHAAPPRIACRPKEKARPVGRASFS
jgi:hypothetical protein